MVDKNSLGILILSGVRHAASYLPLLTARPELALRAICEEPDAPEWAKRDTELLAAQYKVPFLLDPQAALSRADIDLVVVCAEPTRHARLAVAALKAGKHVLLDKPMATNLADADRVVAAAAASGLKCTVINRLFNPAIQRARRMVDAGHLGLPRSVDIEFLANGALFATAVERPEFVVNPALSGGGELRNFLGYPIDFLRYLTGLEVVEIFAETNTLFMEPHRQAGVEDTGILSLRLERDVTATLTVGRVPYAPTAGHTASSLRLVGSHGYLTIDEDEPQIEVWGAEPGLRAYPIGGAAAQNGTIALINNFIQDILEDRTPLYGPRDAWATVAAIDAAYRSAQAGQPVAVEQLLNRQ
jgi:predicted dehydrogenase